MSRAALIPDRSIAVVLAIATALTRLPFAADRLWEWDSVLYARALEHGFHVDDLLAGSRPHPPGYIFYVAAGAIGRGLGLDSDHALVAVSILASGVGVAACYLLCRRFTGRALSLALAVAFAASPLVWLHGEVAMPYILLAPISASLALAFRDARGAAPRRVIAVSFAFGALGGFRQDLLLFLFPLWLWSVAPASTRGRFAATGALIGGSLLWFIPSALLSDGAVAYVTRSVGQLVGVSGTSANQDRSIALNAVLIADSLLWAGLAVTVLALVLGLARGLATLRGQRLPDDREWRFFAIWLVPASLFYLLVHIGEWGFVLSIAPGIFVLLAWLTRPVAERARRAGRVLVAIAAASALLGAGLFVAGDHPVFSRDSLLAHDRATAGKTAYIRDHLPVPTTIVLASAEALVASYYLPEYEVRYSNAGSRRTFDLPVAVPSTVVVYEAAASPASAIRPRVLTVGPGVTLDVIDVPAGSITVRGADLGDLRGSR